MPRILIDRDTWLKLIRGETVNVGDVELALADIGYIVMINDIVDAEDHRRKQQTTEGSKPSIPKRPI